MKRVRKFWLPNMMWNFSQYSNNIAVICEDGRQISYAELDEHSHMLAKQIMPRSLVFNFCSNTFGSLAGYVSCLQHGNVPLMLDQHIDHNLLNKFIELYRPDYLYIPKEKISEFSFDTVYEAEEYILLKTPYRKVYPLHDDLALLLTTSGSMGSPKFVRQSYRNIEANTQAIVNYLKIDAGERAITSLPMNYTYGLSVINSHLAVGASLILTDATLMQREFWTLISDYGATSFAGVPYTYEMLDKLRFMRRELPLLKTLTQAGGKLSPEFHRKFAEYAATTGKNFVVMYGQTEATARMGWLPPEKSLAKAGAMGIAIPGGKFSLIDAEGRVITEPDIVGELVYDGENVALGYAENGTDLAKGDEWHGHLVTGDMAKIDSDGFYYIVGRKKRFLKIFGNRVNLDETERLIKSKFNNLDCACCGCDDAMKIFVTNDNCLKDVQNFVAETSKLNFSAFKVKYIENLPKNEAGKTLYKQLENA